MTAERHELEELKDRIASDPAERARFIAGFNAARSERGLEPEPSPDMVAAAEEPDESARHAAFASVAATGALLFAAPAIVSRVVLAQVGSDEPCLLLLTCPDV